jgi:hypothetical protein
MDNGTGHTNMWLSLGWGIFRNQFTAGVQRSGIKANPDLFLIKVSLI